MTKEDSPGGLLSKMARFVRNPTVNWAELDSIDEDRESQYSKQMLKEMIERKRRNDFVRRREFDQLRKLRQREALQGQRIEDPTARPSFFQSSFSPQPDDRAGTLKKIDEIEAQMSQQWWKGGGPEVPSRPSPPSAASAALAATAGDSTPAPSLASASALGTASAQGDVLQPAARPLPGLSGPAHDAQAFAPTEPASLPADLGRYPESATAARAPEAQALFPHDSRLGAPGSSSARAPLSPPDAFRTSPADGDAEQAAAGQQRAELEAAPEFVHEPDLEEAAIRFANGDHAGAEAALRDVLALHAGDAPAQQLEIWMTLFDLYRATGEHERFDALAIDFAAMFHRSAPLWFSLPALVGAEAATPGDAAAVPSPREFKWSAPPTLALQSVAALQASVQRAVGPCVLTWSRLHAIEPAAVAALADLFGQWADQNLQLVFHGVGSLLGVLQQITPSGDRTAEPQGWRLHMAALRLMNRPEEFELVALDYCVTYEVSPPSWAAPRCSYSDDGEGATGGLSLAPMDDPHSGPGFEISRPAHIDEPMPELRGRVEGDAGALLAPLLDMVPAGAPLVVVCDKLIRVDFAAAGSVLNWTADLEAQGRSVHFVRLPRLVAVFFNVIGINEHARVVPRTN